MFCKSTSPLLAAVMLCGCAKIVVVPVPATATMPAKGVFYALPKTVVRVSMNIERNTYQLARFQKFQDVFAPDIDAICKTATCAEEIKKKFTLKDSTLSSFGEPDPEQVFMVKFTGGWAFDQTMSMTWNEAGVPLNASATVTNRSTDIALSVVKAAAGLSMKSFGFGGGSGEKDVAVPSCPDLSPKTDPWVLPILAPDPNRPVFWRYLVDNYCAIKKDDREKWPEERVLLTAAVEAYSARVGDLVTERLNLMKSGSQNFQPDAMIARIEADIKAQLKQLYVGTKTTRLWSPIVEIRDLKLETPIPILQFDEATGACEQSGAVFAVDSKPRPGAFKPETCPSGAVMLTFTRFPVGQLSERVRTGTTPLKGETSFVYRIPGQAKALISYSNEQAGAATLSVAQFGITAALPARHNSKTITYELAFIEATGGLKSFKLDAKGGLDASAIDSASGVAGSVLDARAKEAQKSDELVLLTREAAIVDAKKKICDSLANLNAPCPYKQ